MKRFIKSISIALLAISALACNQNVDQVMEDHYIDILSEPVFEVGYEETILDVQVDANCKWSVRKIDMNGAAISWLKTDLADGKGSKTFRIKVLRNNTMDSRSGTVNIYSDQVQNYIDVIQAGNPDPDSEPEIFRGYNMPAYQMFESSMGLDVESGKVKEFECNFTNATVEGNTIKFANGLVIEKTGETPANIKMACPTHVHPKSYAGFQLGISAEFASGESWIYKIPMNFELFGDLRFTYGSRKEGITTSDPYKWSTDEGKTWNPVTKMEAIKSDAAFKSIWFTIPEAQKVQPEGSLWIKIDQTANKVYIQNGITLDYAKAPISDIKAQDNSTIVISEGFDGTIEANAAMVAVPGFMKSNTTGYTVGEGTDINPYEPVNAAIQVNHCFARPGFLQVGYTDEAFAVRSGWNGAVTIKVGDRLKEMGISEPKGLKVSFNAATLTNAYSRKSDAKLVLKVDGEIVNTLSEISVDRFSKYTLIVPEVDQNSVLTITSQESSAKKGNGEAPTPYEAADYRFFIDDLLIEAIEVSHELVLDFDMTSAEVMKNWPTTKTPQETAEPPYTTAAFCNGVEYKFVLSNPSGATNNTMPYFKDSKSLFFPKYRFMGFPVIEGYKLVKVVVTDASGTYSDKRGFGITTKVSKQVSQGHDGQEFVTGGEHKSVTGNGPYTFELTGTKASTMYYLRVASQDALISNITLTYKQ